MLEDKSRHYRRRLQVALWVLDRTENGPALVHHRIPGATAKGGTADLKIAGHRALTDHVTMTATVDHHATTMGGLHHRHQRAAAGRTGVTALIFLLPRAKAAIRSPHRLATARTAVTEEGTKRHQETHTYPLTKAVAETALEGPVNQMTANNAEDPATQATPATATQMSDVPTATNDGLARLGTSPGTGETVEHDHVVQIAGTTETDVTTGAETMISTEDGRAFIQRTCITSIPGAFGCSSLVGRRFEESESGGSYECMQYGGRLLFQYGMDARYHRYGVFFGLQALHGVREHAVRALGAR